MSRNELQLGVSNDFTIMHTPLTTIITNIPAPSNDPTAIVDTLGSSFVKAAFIGLTIFWPRRDQFIRIFDPDYGRENIGSTISQGHQGYTCNIVTQTEIVFNFSSNRRTSVNFSGIKYFSKDSKLRYMF